MGTRHITQLSQIRSYLLEGKYITPMDALRLFGCMRLSAYIHKLRHEEGFLINMDQPQASDGKPYARYWIAKEFLRNYLDNESRVDNG